jgi:crotonobetainyl-CoA:carnitine CoA-transferase CaiB-like acyl-CoA transferase
MHRLPLSHIKILDMSRVLAGPYATQLLSDMGAQVIKIETPGNGDDTRSWSPPIHNGSNQSAYYMSANRNKQSVTIDLKSKYGPSIIQQLTSKCDVFIENFKVDGLKKFGLDYHTLIEYNPKLIYCSISGYGQNGPRKYVCHS